MEDDFLAEFPDFDVSELIGLDTQQQHDLLMGMRSDKAKPNQANGKKQVSTSLKRKNGSSKEPVCDAALDPIAAAIKNNPGLTRELAIQMAEEYGF